MFFFSLAGWTDYNVQFYRLTSLIQFNLLMSPASQITDHRTHLITTVIVGSAIAVFLFDTLLPFGFNVPLLYLLPILLAIRLPYASAPFIIAGGTSLLTVLGSLASPIDAWEPGLFNRSLVILASWIAAMVVWYMTQKHIRQELKALVEQRTAALSQSEATLQSFFNSTDLRMGVVEVVDGVIISVATNRPAARHVGITHPSTYNQPLSGMGFTDQDRHFWVDHAEEARRSGKTVRFEYRFPSTWPPGLSDRVMNTAVSFIGLSGRGNALFSWIAEDVTEKKLIEQRMEASRRSLQENQEQLRLLTGELMMAQENERRRISRELHDDLNQRIAGLTFEIEDQLQQLPNLSEDTRESLQTIKSELHELSEHVRSLAHQLHPSVLDDLGIISALKSYAKEFEARERIAVDLDIDGTVHLPSREHELCLYRVAQEALRNVAKHAKASKVRMLLNCQEDDIRLQIQDNGCGFSSAGEDKPKGLGLISMGERVRQLRGTLAITNEFDKGTTLSIRLPLRGVAHEQTPHPTC